MKIQVGTRHCSLCKLHLVLQLLVLFGILFSSFCSRLTPIFRITVINTTNLFSDILYIYFLSPFVRQCDKLPENFRGIVQWPHSIGLISIYLGQIADIFFWMQNYEEKKWIIFLWFFSGMCSFLCVQAMVTVA